MKTNPVDNQSAQNRNWVTHPTKKTLLLTVTACLLGNVLLTLSITNFFTESFINKSYIMVYVLMIMPTLTTLKVIVNFVKTRETVR